MEGCAGLSVLQARKFRWSLFVAVAVAAFLGGGSGAAAPVGRSGSSPLRLTALAPETTFDGPQFFQATRRGEVFLLRGDTLEVYPATRGRLSKPSVLQGADLIDGNISDAAMSPDGRLWAVVDSNRVRTYQDGRLQRNPEVGWLASSVGVMRGTVVAGVLPMTVGRSLKQRPTEPPLVLRLSGQEWVTYVPGVLPQRAKDRDPINALFANHTVDLASDAKGRLWISYPYAGRVIRLTPSGKPDLEVVLGTGTPKHWPNEKARSKELQERLRKQGYDETTKSGVFTARWAIRGLTTGLDGALYMLVDESVTGSGTMIARYDPALGMIQTLPVALPEPGPISMAAGTDGLYLAAIEPGGARWHIGWQRLDQAVWREASDAEAKIRGISSIPERTGE